MINISVLYVACYRCSLHTDKLNPLPSTYSTLLLPDVLDRQCRSNLRLSWLKKYKLLMMCYIWTAVTYLLAYSGWTKETSNIIIATLRTSDHILYDTQQVLVIFAKIWLIWDCKFRYLILCMSSLIVRVSVNKSGVTVCLWLRSELLTAVTCLPCWHVTLSSSIDVSGL